MTKSSLQVVALLPSPVRDKAYDALKSAIIRGQLSPGERLIETQIAHLLSISRTPLREALLKLESAGFVERLPSGGAQVKSLSATEVRELYAVRSVLEGLAAREAAQRLTNGQLADLAVLTRKLRAADSVDPEIQLIADIGEQFHSIILEASRNRTLEYLLRLLRDHIDQYRHLTINIPGRGLEAAKEHAALLSVLRRRNASLSEAAMRRHVLRAREAMMKRLREAKPSALEGALP